MIIKYNHLIIIFGTLPVELIQGRMKFRRSVFERVFPCFYSAILNCRLVVDRETNPEKLGEHCYQCKELRAK